MGLKYVSEISISGYGCASRGYLHALRTSGADLIRAPMVHGRLWNMNLEPYEGHFPLWRAREPGKKLIGVTVWKTDRLLPGDLMNDLQRLDRLIVPCRWNARAFRERHRGFHDQAQ